MKSCKNMQITCSMIQIYLSMRMKVYGTTTKTIAMNSVNIFLFSSKGLYQNEFTRIPGAEIGNGEGQTGVVEFEEKR